MEVDVTTAHKNISVPCTWDEKKEKLKQSQSDLTMGLSKIFVRQATILDCAYLHPTLGPIGKSWYVDVCWAGQQDRDGVVFDFSLAKKCAKKTIDELFDHRLFVSTSSVQHTASKTLQTKNNWHITLKKDDRCLVLADSFALDTYANSLAVFPDKAMEKMQQDGDTLLIEQEIASAILANSPNSVCEVTVRLREHEQHKSDVYFSYTHSLKNHFGNCQRLHGHSNIIEVLIEGSYNHEISLQAAHLLRGKYLVSHDYISTEPLKECGDFLKKIEDLNQLGLWPFKTVNNTIKNQSDSKNFLDIFSRFYAIRYEGSQGAVYCLLPKEMVILMESESSIECISSFVKARLSLGSSATVIAYEGIAKGAMA